MLRVVTFILFWRGVQVMDVIDEEERQFLKTLSRGKRLFERTVARLDGSVIPGEGWGRVSGEGEWDGERWLCLIGFRNMAAWWRKEERRERGTWYTYIVWKYMHTMVWNIKGFEVVNKTRCGSCGHFWWIYTYSCTGKNIYMSLSLPVTLCVFLCTQAMWHGVSTTRMASRST